MFASSAIIEEVYFMRSVGLATLAYFYCDFKENQKKSLHGLLSWLLYQLCRQSDTYCNVGFEFYSEHAESGDNAVNTPNDDALVACLKNLLKLPGAPVYLIVDALDECPNTSTVPSPRAKVLKFLEDLIRSQVPNLHICVTSRLEADIKDVLDPLIPRQISLHDERGQKRDIEDYIRLAIDGHPKSGLWKAEDKRLVIDVLTEKADGR